MKTIQVSNENWKKINNIRKQNNLRNNNEVIDEMFSYIAECEAKSVSP